MKPKKKFLHSNSALAASEICSNIINMCFKKKAAHMGGALSIADFLSVYYSFFHDEQRCNRLFEDLESWLELRKYIQGRRMRDQAKGLFLQVLA